MTIGITTLSIMTLIIKQKSIAKFSNFNELCVFILSVIVLCVRLSIITLNVIILSAIVLSVVTPSLMLLC